MAFAYDHATRQFGVTGGQTLVEVQDVVNLARTEEATERGIVENEILAKTGGKFELDTGITTGIDCQLAADVTLHFEAGAYSATVKGGNLVGGPSNEPIAYSAGVRVRNIQVEGHSISTAGTPAISNADKEDIAERVWKQPVSDVTLSAAGTFGEFVIKKLLTLGRFIGLGS